MFGRVARLVEANDQVATETPVALVYNGISHVVMMSTPSDLEDFVTGFSLSEDIIASTKQILDVEEIVTDKGIELHMTIVAEAFFWLKRKTKKLSWQDWLWSLWCRVFRSSNTQSEIGHQ